MKISLAMICLLLVLFQPVFAAMGSTNYYITSSVLSGGGSPMGSANFQTNSTLGQASPVTPTSSDTFEAYPGFWYTLTQPFCPWDLEPADPNGDGDVDGLDLNAFIDDFDPGVSGKYDEIHLEDFANEFGKTDCSD
ncbi:MAG: hypothetical protein GY699_25505 [Desulfobacteraceae bacterium]|nr:hypothetical protein [Desulfobacteraceae bacterium]